MPETEVDKHVYVSKFRDEDGDHITPIGQQVHEGPLDVAPPDRHVNAANPVKTGSNRKGLFIGAYTVGALALIVLALLFGPQSMVDQINGVINHARDVACGKVDKTAGPVGSKLGGSGGGDLQGLLGTLNSGRRMVGSPPISLGGGCPPEAESAQPAAAVIGQPDMRVKAAPTAGVCTVIKGDGVCSACENTDLDSADCVCNMNGVCDPGEGFNCPDCQATAPPTQEKNDKESNPPPCGHC